MRSTLRRALRVHRSWLGVVPALLATCFVASTSLGVEPQPTLEQIRRGKIRGFPAPSAADTDLITEGYRLYALATRFGWQGLGEIFPPPTLLVTPEGEYLMGHPAPPDEYFLTKRPDPFFMQVYAKDTEQSCDQASARPLYGAATIVKGSKSCSKEGATDWIFDYTRCCFRLYAYQHQDLLKLSRLNLPFPDPMEQWKQAFPFPYKDPAVISAFRELAHTLSNSFWVADSTEKAQNLAGYAGQRAKLKKLLDARSKQYSTDDFLRYIEWSEGVALFSAHEIMTAVSRQASAFPATLRQYPDFLSYGRFVDGPLKVRFQRFRTLTNEPLAFDDLVMLGALTTAACAATRPGWREHVFTPNVWLEDLMAQAPPSN